MVPVSFPAIFGHLYVYQSMLEDKTESLRVRTGPEYKNGRAYARPFSYYASTRGFEPPTPRLGGVCSILLSYVDIYNKRYCNVFSFPIQVKIELFVGHSSGPGLIYTIKPRCQGQFAAGFPFMFQ